MLAHWPMSSLRWQNTRYQNLEKAKTNNNCVTNYRRPARGPHESKNGEINTKSFNVSGNIVSLLVLLSTFRGFHLA